MVKVAVVVLPHGEGLELPRRATPGSAGLDLVAAIMADRVIVPFERALIPTGLCLAIPPGWEGEVRPRSGLALRHGITLVNAPGTIDADYRGELSVPLIHLGAEPYLLRRGDRIAQILFHPVYEVELERVDQLPPAGERVGGFGSTGQ